MAIIDEKDIFRIKSLLKKVIGSTEYVSVVRLGGLTNHTYKVNMADRNEYVIRIPGEGTEEMICRADERISTQLANELEIDAELLYFGEDGSKVSRYISNSITLDRTSMQYPEVIQSVANILAKLHTCGKDTGIRFDVFDMAKNYERIIADNQVMMYADYEDIKSQIMLIKKRIDTSCQQVMVPCHNDPLCENWISGNERLYLIDWEYAGMNDAMWDLADVSIEADYNTECDNLLLESYFGREPSLSERERFFANKLFLDYLWTLWGKAREPFDGEEMARYEDERYERLKNNIKIQLFSKLI